MLKKTAFIFVFSLIAMACGSQDSPEMPDPCESLNPPARCDGDGQNNSNNQNNANNLNNVDESNNVNNIDNPNNTNNVNNVDCVPQTEMCDGEDNDCDGEVDEGFDLGDACEEGVGACANTGETVCSENGMGTVCSAQAGDPAAAEICDGIDNNCNGEIDEGFDDLGTACTNGTGECVADGVLVCNSEGDGLECDAEPGQPSPEICDGLDNNCDGTADETFTMKGMSCTSGLGACEAAGTFVCDTTGQGVVCDATPGQPTAEVCDGIDNDCNGVEDDGASDANTYYVDCDGDGFAASTGGSRDACSSPPDSVARTACAGASTATWTATLPSSIANTDCEDTLSDVRPNQFRFFDVPYTTQTGATSFDYDCNGNEEQYDPQLFTGGQCQDTTPILSIQGKYCEESTASTPGTAWYSVIPDCGVTGLYLDCQYTLTKTTDIIPRDVCEASSNNYARTMECR